MLLRKNTEETALRSVAVAPAGPAAARPFQQQYAGGAFLPDIKLFMVLVELKRAGRLSPHSHPPGPGLR
jgi:quercetin dioxygenase-like cupin family protein